MTVAIELRCQPFHFHEMRMIPTIRTLSLLGVIATIMWLVKSPGYPALLACIVTFSVLMCSFLPLRKSTVTDEVGGIATVRMMGRQNDS